MHDITLVWGIILIYIRDSSWMVYVELQSNFLSKILEFLLAHSLFVQMLKKLT